MAPRWKGKDAEATALADPMSKIIEQLRSSLTQSGTEGFLSGSVVLLSVKLEQIDQLNRSCFGRPRITTEKEKQWFQISFEEAFYMSHSLKCLRILGEDKCLRTEKELWESMKSKRTTFPQLYIAYSHLRNKNWVVRSGPQYGVDFVAYRHHPSLVHSEFAVIVQSQCEGDDSDTNFRLRVWSDLQSSVRLCGSVAKTFLVLNISRNEQDFSSPWLLNQYEVEERTITRWSPEQCREE